MTDRKRSATIPLVEPAASQEKSMARRRLQRGTVFQRGKEKVWVGRWREDLPDGSRPHKSVVLGTQQDFPTKRLAQRALDKLVDEAGVNGLDYRPKAQILFRDFAEQWQRDVLPQHQPSSVASEKSVLRNYLIPFFGGYPLDQIKTPLVQQFIAQQSAKGLKPATVRCHWTALKTMWNTAIAWGYVDHELRHVRLPKLGIINRRAFTIEEMQKIVEKAQGDFKTYFWLASETGARVGELTGLPWENVDLVNGEVHIRQSVWRGQVKDVKTQNGIRDCPISPQLCEQLRAMQQETGFVFHTSEGKPWAQSHVFRELKTITDQLGFKPGGSHAFRHGNATALIASGEDPKTVAARLGHRDAAITLRIYAHASNSLSKQMSNKLGAILAPQVEDLFPIVPNSGGNA